MTTKKELDAHICHLERRVDNLVDEIERIKRGLRQWGDEFDERVEAAIAGKIRYQVVANLDAYEKGSKIKKDIKHIKEVL